MALAGVDRAIRKQKTKRGYVILMYHRVLRSGTSNGVQPGMYVDKDTFEQHIAYLNKHFEVVPLAELLFRAAASGQASHSKALCGLTFDDGWVDFYENAYPILRGHKVPATVFLPTEFIGTTKRFWTDRLACMIECGSLNGRITSFSQQPPDPIVSALVRLKGSRENRLERAVALLKRCPQEKIDRLLRDISSYLGVDLNLASRAFISWQEAKEMHKSNLLTFGSHTAGHKILTLLPDEEVIFELTSSKEKLKNEGVVDESFVPFCYPNGIFDKRIMGMVREAGYQMAVTTETGWNNWSSPALALHRIGIHQDMTSTNAMYGGKIAGLI